MARKRIITTITDVDTDWTNGNITKKPANYVILRARAIVIDGPATQVALRVKRSNQSGDQYIDLEYELTDDYIDSAEDVWFKSDTVEESGTGTTYFQVKTDSATPSDIVVILDIEV